jgi:hypothetical protein
MKAGETIEQDGKKYLVLGKTFGTKTKLAAGDRFVLEGETLNLERDDEGKVVKASVWVPEVIEPTDKAADSLDAIVKRAKEHGVLQEKVRHEGGEVEYLPTDAGKPSSATKGRWVTIGGRPVYIEKSRGVPSGKVADSYMTWKSEDTITGNMVVEHKEDKPPTNEQLELFVIDNLANEVESLRGPKDVESVKITNREEGPGWVSFEVDVTPTEAAGDRWLEEEGGTEEWLTYHGQSSYDEKAEAEAYPDESKKLRFVFQSHYRGKSQHGDFRAEYKRGNQHYLRGWTVAMQQPGAIKEPVTMLEQAKKEDAKPGNWKMNLDTGEIKQRQTRGGDVRRGSLRAFPKASEIPADWLNVEGVTEKQDPGEPPPAGATKQYPGVFHILQKGTIEFGAQKPWAHEFFIHGNNGWHGRWLFRLVRREGEKWFTPTCEADMLAFKAETLPPGKEEENHRTAGYWILMQPLDQTPYVLSREATSENWLPPKGVSCLPAKMRKSVPKELRYWEMDRKEALEARAKLAEFEELGGTELKLIVLREVTEDEKAKAGRWRTLPDGRRVLVTAAAAGRFGGGGKAPGGAGATNNRKLDDFLSENTQEGWKSANSGERAEAKIRTVRELAERSGMPEGEVNSLIRQWAYSSNDDDARSLSLQKDAADEFALPLSDFSKEKLDHVGTSFRQLDEHEQKHHRDLLEAGGSSPYFPLDSSSDQRKFLRTMYDSTQQRLRKQGLKGNDTVTLYRGVRLSTSEVKGWKEGSYVPVVGNTLESWSVGSGIAANFAGQGTGGAGTTSVVLAMDVPVKMIVGTAKTGFGCLSEGEVVVLGSKGGTAEVWFIQD